MLILIPRFPIGRLVATPAAIEAAPKEVLLGFLHRHISCDWGDVPEKDAKANNYAMWHEQRIISCYLTADKARVFVITEADRSSTTVLMADEY